MCQYNDFTSHNSKQLVMHTILLLQRLTLLSCAVPEQNSVSKLIHCWICSIQFSVPNAFSWFMLHGILTFKWQTLVCWTQTPIKLPTQFTEERGWISKNKCCCSSHYSLRIKYCLMGFWLMGLTNYFWVLLCTCIRSECIVYVQITLCKINLKV